MKYYESEQEKLHVFKTFKNGVDIGAILISRQWTNIIYLIGWSSEEGRKLNVNYLLLWEALIYFKSNFDYERIQSLFSNLSSLNIFELNENYFDSKIIEKIHEADFILVSIPPINGEDIVFKHFKSELKKIKAKWITYLSATSVYGDHNGEWVNEKSLTKPTSENGISRLAAEKKLSLIHI